MPEGQYEPGEETKYRQDQNLSTEKENVADTQINSAPVVQPENSPRVLASMQLTEQAYRFIKVNRPDDAIRVLERSLNLSPTNGQTFYYLAEAWLMKRNIQQAIEFNRLSEIYLRDDPVWMIRVEKQRELLIK